MDNINASVGNRIPAVLIYDTANSIVQSMLIQTLTQTGNTATATVVGHGLTTGASVVIAGADQTAYNGTYTATVVDNDHFTYTVSGSPASPATTSVAASLTVSFAGQSLIAQAPSIIQVDTVPASTQATIQGRVHSEAMWSPLMVINPTDGPTLLLLHGSPINQVCVIRSSGTGDLKAWAQGSAVREYGY